MNLAETAGAAKSSGRGGAGKEECELPSVCPSVRPMSRPFASTRVLQAHIPYPLRNSRGHPIPAVGAKIHACLAPCIPGECLLHGFLVPVPEAPSHPPRFPAGGRFLLIGTSPLCSLCAITLCTQQEVGCQQEVGSSSRPALATTLLPASSVGR